MIWLSLGLWALLMMAMGFGLGMAWQQYRTTRRRQHEELSP